jgi:hypothetical protein
VIRSSSPSDHTPSVESAEPGRSLSYGGRTPEVHSIAGVRE